MIFFVFLMPMVYPSQILEIIKSPSIIIGKDCTLSISSLTLSTPIHKYFDYRKNDETFISFIISSSLNHDSIHCSGPTETAMKRNAKRAKILNSFFMSSCWYIFLYKFLKIKKSWINKWINHIDLGKLVAAKPKRIRSARMQRKIIQR